MAAESPVTALHLPEQHRFCTEVAAGAGVYVIAAARYRELGRMAAELREDVPGIEVHPRQWYARWPSGASAYLISAAPPYGERRLRGLRFDGAWLLDGPNDLRIPSSFKEQLLTRANGPHFKLWESWL